MITNAPNYPPMIGMNWQTLVSDVPTSVSSTSMWMNDYPH